MVTVESCCCMLFVGDSGSAAWGDGALDRAMGL